MDRAVAGRAVIERGVAGACGTGVNSAVIVGEGGAI